jgi:hypothetical protein
MVKIRNPNSVGPMPGTPQSPSAQGAKPSRRSAGFEALSALGEKIKAKGSSMAQRTASLPGKARQSFNEWGGTERIENAGRSAVRSVSEQFKGGAQRAASFSQTAQRRFNAWSGADIYDKVRAAEQQAMRDLRGLQDFTARIINDLLGNPPYPGTGPTGGFSAQPQPPQPEPSQARRDSVPMDGSGWRMPEPDVPPARTPPYPPFTPASASMPPPQGHTPPRQDFPPRQNSVPPDFRYFTPPHPNATYGGTPWTNQNPFQSPPPPAGQGQWRPGPAPGTPPSSPFVMPNFENYLPKFPQRSHTFPPPGAQYAGSPPFANPGYAPNHGPQPGTPPYRPQPQFFGQGYAQPNPPFAGAGPGFANQPPQWQQPSQPRPQPQQQWHQRPQYSQPQPQQQWHQRPQYSQPQPQQQWHQRPQYSQPQPQQQWHQRPQTSRPQSPPQSSWQDQRPQAQPGPHASGGMPQSQPGPQPSASHDPRNGGFPSHGVPNEGPKPAQTRANESTAPTMPSSAERLAARRTLGLPDTVSEQYVRSNLGTRRGRAAMLSEIGNLRSAVVEARKTLMQGAPAGSAQAKAIDSAMDSMMDELRVSEELVQSWSKADIPDATRHASLRSLGLDAGDKPYHALSVATFEAMAGAPEGQALIQAQLDAMRADVRQAYRKLSLANHPDRKPGAGEKFKEIGVANGTLMEMIQVMQSMLDERRRA